ncbi:GTPase Der [Glycine max]|nr:GTPase Der [Glycine max]
MARTLTLIPISYTFAKTLNPIFPFNNTLPFSSSILYRQKLTRRTLSCSVLRPTAGEFSGSVDDEESDDLDDLDVVALEQEAKDAVQAYSSSLSQILSIEDEEKSDRKESAQSRRKSPRRTKIIPDNLLPRVAIVGRPNVGKSALYNRLVGGNRAIVVDEPGVTRDRLYGRSYWGEHEFMVVDTGGVITVSKSQATVMEELAITTTIGMDGIPLAVREAAVAWMPSMIERQATAAVEESSVIIFLVDGQEKISDCFSWEYNQGFISELSILCYSSF